MQPIYVDMPGVGTREKSVLALKDIIEKPEIEQNSIQYSHSWFRVYREYAAAALHAGQTQLCWYS